MNFDKNTITGYVLIACVLFGFMFYNQHQMSEQAQYQHEQDSIQAVKAAKDAKAAAELKAKQEAEMTAQQNDSTNALFAARQGKEGSTKIENEYLVVNISNKGGQIDYVLGEWSEEETKGMPELLDRACKAIKAFITMGPDRAMNICNTKPKEIKTEEKPD